MPYSSNELTAPAHAGIPRNEPMLPVELWPTRADSVRCDDPIDREAIQELLRELGGIPLTSLLPVFKSESPRMLEAIRSAVATTQANALRRAAHELKGACGHFGAERLLSLCEDMENHARHNECWAAVSLLEPLLHEHSRVMAALDDFAADPGDSIFLPS